jgi:hypothetical protein
MDANERLHRDWLGMAQPEGLVVTASVLKEAEANITWPATDLQVLLKEQTHEGRVWNLRSFFRDVLAWSDDYVIDRSTMPPELGVTVEEGDKLVPTYALKSADEEGAFAFLVTEALDGTDFDAAYDERRWTASAHQRFERLLRETGLGVGLLTNGRDFRLVYAPKGESAGWITFRLTEMLSVDGRPLLGAFHMLLNEPRLLTLPEDKRLLSLLQKSRAYQSTVSTALREQVLGALRTLLQGFQAADTLAEGKLLRPYHGEAMREVYLGIVTVLMRMVFVLFAEERELLPMGHDLYAESYSLTKLYAQLAKDRGEYGDGLDNRYGAWARVLTLFRVLHDGLRTAGGLRLPAREGKLFNPDEFPFLEGRPRGSVRQKGERLQVPRVSDGAVYRVLDQLLVLAGERLQYKGLDVEQIGSVYEGLMGFELEYAEGDSLCLSPDHVVVNLEKLLKLPGAERIKQLKAEANLDVKDKAANEVKAATTVQALHAGLGRRISQRQPGLLPRGTLYMQPGEERRRSGSHYTPRSLTQPIVETTLRPVLERLSAENGAVGGTTLLTPEQILSLKVCDPAMGSGAFLVEVCRQLADHLVAAWRKSGVTPDLPPDEDPLLHARRLVAQRCLYGVDKNPLAVDLARLSMWLVTFAKEHPFTFVDHALRAGDSLVGLSKDQIIDLTPFPIESGAEAEKKPAKGKKAAAAKQPATQLDLVRPQVVKAVEKADELRQQIHAQGDPPDNAELRRLWKDTNDALARVRLLGDLVVAAYFGADTDKGRKTAIENLRAKVQHWLSTGELEAELRGMVAELREGDRPLEPFHWEIEFPEVFGRENPGFDCFVGNPPFLGGSRISGSLGEEYLAWLLDSSSDSSGHADISAHFFQRVFRRLRASGSAGLVATNSISQGATRGVGLGWIRRNGGCLYDVNRRVHWPGSASVVVSTVCVARRQIAPCRLDQRVVPTITSFLFHRGGDEAPAPLRTNVGMAFVGVSPQGMGFIFSDDDPDATPLREMSTLIEIEPRNRERIFQYIGGDDLNSSPTHSSSRFIIDFGDMSESDAKAWPELFAIVEAKVKPARAKARPDRRDAWWLYVTRAPELKEFLREHVRCLAVATISKTLAFTFVERGSVLNKKIVAFSLDDFASFAILQSRIHEMWARFLGSTLKDDLAYSPDCFDPFPLPISSTELLNAGQVYYALRRQIMIDAGEGMTKTYNKFHDPDCHLPGIVRLRELHAQMDRAVLDAYGWQDIRPEYDFREQLDESVRLTWAEETRDEVLARLLELNRVMAEAEAAETAKGEEAKKVEKATRKTEQKAAGAEDKKPRGGRKKGEPEGQGGLFS